MRARTFCATIAIALGVSHSAAQAAPADTTPFHQGQWAAQFVAGTQFVSAGAIHFRSPVSAWLFDGSFQYSHSTEMLPATPASATIWNAGGTLRIGLRHYRPLGPSTNFYTTYGALIQGGTGSSSGPYSSDSWFWGAGVFGELGANYMLTPRFSLGAAAGIQARFVRQYWTAATTTGTETGTNDLISVSGALLSLHIAVYF